VRSGQFAYGSADATVISSSLASLKPEWFTFLVPADPYYPGKDAIKRVPVLSV